MRNEPTFYQGMDWYGLVELGPAAREVLNLLLTSCRPGRKGYIEHSVHVMATWFPEVTRHWGTPMTAAKARRGLNELIEKGVLTRHNDPKDGSGFVVTFNMNPPQHAGVPVNGFRHAEEVAERCGTKAVFRRINDDQDDPQPRANKVRAPSDADQVDPFSDKAPVESEPEDADPEFDTSGLGGSRPTGELTDIQQEFASELEEATGKNQEPRLRLLAGQCEKIAQEAGAALGRGWPPEVLARRLASELNPKIHSPQQFLIRKLGEVGKAPSKRPLSTLDRTVQQVDRVTIDQLEDPEAIARVEAVKARYQENFRARQMTGRKS